MKRIIHSFYYRDRKYGVIYDKQTGRFEVVFIENGSRRKSKGKKDIGNYRYIL